MNFTFTGEFSKIENYAVDDRLFIYGPASAEIVDNQGDIIEMEAIKKALPQLLKRARVTVDHKDQIVGEIVESVEKKGLIYKTEVRLPLQEEVSKYNKLEKDKEALFVLAEIWNDTKYCSEIRKAIESGEYKSYSISGNVVNSRPCRSDENCARIVSDLNLSAVTICREGANPAAQFDILKRDDKMTEEAKPIEEKVEFVTKADFDNYKAEIQTKLEPLSKIDEIYDLIKSRKKEEEPKENPEVKEEPKPEGIEIKIEKMKAELYEELKKEFFKDSKPVQTSADVEEKEPTFDELAETLAKIKFR